MPFQHTASMEAPSDRWPFRSWPPWGTAGPEPPVWSPESHTGRASGNEAVTFQGWSYHCLVLLASPPSSGERLPKDNQPSPSCLLSWEDPTGAVDFQLFKTLHVLTSSPSDWTSITHRYSQHAIDKHYVCSEELMLEKTLKHLNKQTKPRCKVLKHLPTGHTSKVANCSVREEASSLGS